MYIQNSYRFGEELFRNAEAIYSLRKFFNWSNAVLKIRRSSDDAEVWVFFNGSSNQNLITISSYISTSSRTVADATTLSTWLSTDDAFVSEWIFQQNSNAIDTAKIINQTTLTKQPKFAAAGVIETKNGKPTITFDGTNDKLEKIGEHFVAFETGHDSTSLTVSYSNSTANAQGFFSTEKPSPDLYLAFLNHRGAGKWAAFVIADTTAIPLLLSQLNSADQRMQAYVIDGSGKKITNYLNGTIQTVDAAWTGAFFNTDIRIGAWAGTGYLDGGVQEIIIFLTNKTSNLTALHNNIDTYYSIP